MRLWCDTATRPDGAARGCVAYGVILVMSKSNSDSETNVPGRYRRAVIRPQAKCRGIQSSIGIALRGEFWENAADSVLLEK